MVGVSIAQARRAWLLYGLRNKILPRISISRPANFETLLSAEEVADLSSIFQRFANDFNIDPSTEVAQDQPFRLEFFSAFNQITRDIDAVLPSLLRDGVSTGVHASMYHQWIWLHSWCLILTIGGQLQITPT